MLSSTFSSWPPAIVYDLLTARSWATGGAGSMAVGVGVFIFSVQMEAPFGIGVKATPDQLVHCDDEDRHHGNAGDDQGYIAGLGDLRDVGSQPVGLQGGITPGSEFCHDAGVPRTA